VKECLWCAEKTDSPIRATLWHFRLVDWGQWRYWRGNIRTFGWRGGLLASLSLSFPIFNALWNWRYRKMRLEVKP
jgi:hypothetical protein